jgi:hypothetical protein
MRAKILEGIMVERKRIQNRNQPICYYYYLHDGTCVCICGVCHFIRLSFTQPVADIV